MSETHPIFEGLGLKEGAVVGMELPLSYRELDSLPMKEGDEIDRGRYPKALKDLDILMTSWGYDRNRHLKRIGVMSEGRFEGGGKVLHTGSHGWVNAAKAGEGTAAQILLNAYDYLLKGDN